MAFRYKKLCTSARIIIMDIDGKIEAQRIETAYTLSYKKQHRRRPRGNLED